MVFLVLFQVHFALEAVEAVRAVIGLVPAVFTAVGDEVRALTEGLATHLAHMWLLTWQEKANINISILDRFTR